MLSVLNDDMDINLLLCHIHVFLFLLFLLQKLSENFGLENHLMEVDEENGRVNLKSGLCN